MAPSQWFDQISLSPLRKTSPMRRRKLPSRNSLHQSISLPSLPSSPVGSPVTSPIEDLFASIHSRNRLRPSHTVNPREMQQERKLLEEARLEAAREAMVVAGEEAARRLKNTRKRNRKRKMNRILAEKKQAEEDRQRSILSAIERKKKLRKRSHTRDDVTIATSPFSRDNKKKNAEKKKKKRWPILLNQFAEEAQRWAEHGDPFGGMRINIRKRTGVELCGIDSFGF